MGPKVLSKPQYCYFKESEMRLFSRKASAVMSLPEIKHASAQLQESTCGGEIPVNANFPEVNKFVDKILRFSYGSCPQKLLATHERITDIYRAFFNASLAVKAMEGAGDVNGFARKFLQKIFPRISRTNGWGDYGITENLPLSFVEGRSTPSFIFANACKRGEKLADGIERIMRGYDANHFFPDVRYLMYLDANPEMVPSSLKDGKDKVFASVVMAFSEPHVLVAKWDKVKESLAIELFPLKKGLDEGTADMVMWQK
jgi:hypothetical protein